MDVIEELKSRLNNIPGVRYESDASSITVLPASEEGFTVSVAKNGKSYTVYFNGWHEELESAEETIEAFGFGLSDECRLREYRRGNFAYKWTLESFEDGEWRKYSTTGLLVFPFWRRSQMRYLQNKFLVQQPRD